MAWVGSWRAAARLWQGKDYARIGISDSGFSFHLGALFEQYAPRTLIIDRPEAEVNASLDRVGVTGTNYAAMIADAVTPFLGHPLVRRVTFNSLADHAVVRACLWHLMPGATIDAAKIDLFQRLNIQADMGTVWADVAARGRNLVDVIGEQAAAALEKR